jgi:heparanase 1
MKIRGRGIRAGFAGVALALLSHLAGAQDVTIEPKTMPRIGSVSERYQSYNVEMVEVTGGRFWKPYASAAGADAGKIRPATSSAAPGGIDPGLFQQRPPIDLGNARLRKLATALGPAYMRVSGTWANTTFFQDTDSPSPGKTPEGFGES